MHTVNANQPSKTARDWHAPSCFGCGTKNSHGLKAEFPFDEENGEVAFEYNPSEWMEGAPHHVHGGILASLLDEAQGVLCFHIGHTVMTDELQVKYHLATTLYEPFRVRCWLTAVRRRRMYTRATIHSLDGKLLASSRAVWYVLPDRVMRRMFKDRFDPAEETRVKDILEANRKRAKNIRRHLRKTKTGESRASSKLTQEKGSTQSHPV